MFKIMICFPGDHFHPTEWPTGISLPVPGDYLLSRDLSFPDRQQRLYKVNNVTFTEERLWEPCIFLEND